jgi:hypothetical protein
VHAFPEGHVVSVRSTPAVISSAIAVIAASVMYSSTKKKPAMSPLKCFVVPVKLSVPKYAEVVISGIIIVCKLHMPVSSI